MKPKKITKMENVSAQEMAVKTKVMTILKMNDFEYNSTLYETGLLWLNKNYIPAMVDFLERSKTFWLWYKNQYSLIDSLFIQSVNEMELYQNSSKALVQKYFQMQIAMPYFPNRTAHKIIMSESIPQILNKSCHEAQK